ncbi:hypothetical protein [Plasticicumulans sp.]|uniref:hypothetical protein n=1 Tax=Plasticicumulans sp. TaxID=2307179 RepID=UPI00395F1D5B
MIQLQARNPYSGKLFDPPAAGDQHGNIAVGGIRQLWRDDFAGSAIDSAKWLATVDPSMTLSVGTSLVTIAPNAAAAYVGETVLVSQCRLTAPVRVVLGVKTAATRVVGQYVFFELVAVNADGTLDENNRISFGNQISSTTATAWSYTTVVDGEIVTANVGSMASLANSAGALAEIVIDNEEVTLVTGLMAAGRSLGGVSLQTNLPDPLREYVIRIRVGTDATYTGAGTNVVLYHVLALDYAEVTAEISGGRGLSPASQSLPVAAQGAVASNAGAGSVFPLISGVLTRSANPTALGATAAAHLFGDLAGRAVVQLGSVPQLQDANRQVLTGTTETTLIAAVASVRHVLHTLVIANLSAANAVQVDLRDTTSGTIRITATVPAGQTVVLPIPDGWAQAAVNTNWTAQATGSAPNVAVCAKSFRLPY